jgi:prolipoprotein diacylglyceryltransferase
MFRFFMEYLRLDNSFVGGINANQTLMIVIAILSAGFIIWRHQKPRQGEAEISTNDKNLVEE